MEEERIDGHRLNSKQKKMAKKYFLNTKKREEN
jgi:hypothetical protein